MPKGFTGAILRVNLTTGSIQEQSLGEEFYRMYRGGGAFGTYFLLKETHPDTDALAEENVLTIAPGVRSPATSTAAASASRSARSRRCASC